MHCCMLALAQLKDACCQVQIAAAGVVFWVESAAGEVALLVTKNGSRGSGSDGENFGLWERVAGCKVHCWGQRRSWVQARLQGNVLGADRGRGAARC